MQPELDLGRQAALEGLAHLFLRDQLQDLRHQDHHALLVRRLDPRQALRVPCLVRKGRDQLFQLALHRLDRALLALARLWPPYLGLDEALAGL
eukprot:1835057-Rhodomonas_salina.1